MMDAFTKYAKVCDISNKESPLVAQFFHKFAFRSGSPIQIHSDSGKEYINKLSAELFELLQIKHKKTLSPCPQANAQVEVFNKILETNLASFVEETSLDWKQYIPALMLLYNTSYNSTFMTIPYKLVFGMHPRTPHCRVMTQQYPLQ